MCYMTIGHSWVKISYIVIKTYYSQGANKPTTSCLPAYSIFLKLSGMNKWMNGWEGNREKVNENEKIKKKMLMKRSKSNDRRRKKKKIKFDYNWIQMNVNCLMVL